MDLALPFHPALQTSAQYNAIDISTSKGYSQATILLRRISMTRQSMMHFVVNLKSYLMLEVIEGGWKELERDIEKAQTLDDVIQAHDRYINGVLRKSLFGQHMDADASETPRLLLSLADVFCTYQQQLFDQALEAAERASRKRREAEERVTQGEWGFQSEKEMKEEESFFGLADDSKLDAADRISENFSELIVEMLNALDRKLNGSPVWDETSSLATPLYSVGDRAMQHEDKDDLDSLRFLTFQLDHNGFYGTSDSQS